MSAVTSPVTDVRVDDEGIFARTEDELVLDVLFDERRIWSFWLLRDGEPRDGGAASSAWPPALRRFLNGTTRLQVVEHVDRHVVYDEEVRLGDAATSGSPSSTSAACRSASTRASGSPRPSTPAAPSTSPRCWTRSRRCSGALRKAGHRARSRLRHAARRGPRRPADRPRQRRRPRLRQRAHATPSTWSASRSTLQRALADMGYRITRYSGAAFKVDVIEADGSVRGLDVFGGFLLDGTPAPDGRDPHAVRARTGSSRSAPPPSRAASCRPRRTPTGSSPRPTARAGGSPTRRTTSRRPSRPTAGSTAGSGAPGSSARSGTAPTPRATCRGRARPGAVRPSPAGYAAQQGGVPEQVVDLGCGRGADALLVRPRRARPGPRARLRHRAAATRPRRSRRPRASRSSTAPINLLRAPLGARPRAPGSPTSRAPASSPRGTSPTPPTRWAAATSGAPPR